jgi:transcriptional regulator with XRE-family HTH domain
MARRRDEELLAALGARLRLLRTSRGLTQERLAEAIGVRTATISRFETGDVGFSITTLARLAEALRVEMSELVDLHAEPVSRALTPGDEALDQLMCLPEVARDRAIVLALAMVRGARQTRGACGVLGLYDWAGDDD